jgi:hypothetical protein
LGPTRGLCGGRVVRVRQLSHADQAHLPRRVLPTGAQGHPHMPMSERPVAAHPRRTDRRICAAESGLGSSARRLADQPVLVLPGRPHCLAGAGDGGAEARGDTRVAGDVYGKRLRAGGKWETAGKRPGARGNIEGRRRAYLINAGLRPHGRRCACCGSRDVAVARRTARSGSAEMPRPTACTAGLGDYGFPGGFQVLRMSCKKSRGARELVRARAASCATPQL